MAHEEPNLRTRRRRLDDFVDALSEVEIGSTFNQYAHVSLDLERPDGAAVRRENLREHLQTRLGRCSLILVGEAPGYRGWRFTGISFTQERRLPPERRTSLQRDGWAEVSATVVDRTLHPLGAHDTTVRWGTVPFHPHRPGVPLSNRTPTAAEAKAGAPLAAELIDIMKPQLVIAVGRIAERHFPEATAVRHPAHGGARLFQEGVEDAWRSLHEFPAA